MSRTLSHQLPVVKSADRALELLELFDSRPEGLTLSEACGVTGWPKSSMLALLRTLERRRFLDTSYPDGRYRLGARVASLGLAHVGSLDIAQQGADIVRSVSRTCDETVHLGILKGTDVLYVAKEEGGGHMRMVSMVGRMIPAHGTGVGKALLAGRSSEELDQLYPPGQDLPALTDRTVTDRDEFLEQLARIREQGYATDVGESTIGVCCYAAPVLDMHGETVAAMSVSVPEPRFTIDRRAALFDALLRGARELSIRLGCPDDRLPTAEYPEGAEVTHGAR